MNKENRNLSVAYKARTAGRYMLIPIEAISVTPGYNVRHENGANWNPKDEQDKALALDIIRRGVQEPLAVAEGENCYELVRGHRRHSAVLAMLASTDAEIAKAAKLIAANIPVIIIDNSDEEAMTIDLVGSNIHQKALSSLQQGRVFRRYADLTKSNGTEIAKKFSVTPAHVGNCALLTKFPKIIRAAMDDGILSCTAALGAFRAIKDGAEKSRIKEATAFLTSAIEAANGGKVRPMDIAKFIDDKEEETEELPALPEIDAKREAEIEATIVSSRLAADKAAKARAKEDAAKAKAREAAEKAAIKSREAEEAEAKAKAAKGAADKAKGAAKEAADKAAAEAEEEAIKARAASDKAAAKSNEEEAAKTKAKLDKEAADKAAKEAADKADKATLDKRRKEASTPVAPVVSKAGKYAARVCIMGTDGKDRLAEVSGGFCLVDKAENEAVIAALATMPVHVANHLGRLYRATLWFSDTDSPASDWQIDSKNGNRLEFAETGKGAMDTLLHMSQAPTDKGK